MAGAGVYTYEIVRALALAHSNHRLFVFARHGLFDDLPGDAGIEVVYVEPDSRVARLAWEQTTLPLLLRRLDIDLLHSPHHHTPVGARLSGRRRTKLVVTIHDLTFMLIPERYPLTRRAYMTAATRASALIADAIVTPSNAVRDEVISHLGIRQERIVAIPEAPSARYQIAPPEHVHAARKRYGLPQCYMLSVGSLEPGKNRARLFQALASLLRKGIDPHVAIVGQPAWRYESDYERVREFGLGDHVSFLGYVPDEDMPALYGGATVFAFPSLHEGFGLPVLEAMSCGTPVVTSSGSATAEVAGDAALLVDPLDSNAIAVALERLLCDDELRAGLRARGLKRASEFSWERTARETMLLYELVASQ
jgi:glycosyltransferase involved in cell wall biosynthesis